MQEAQSGIIQLDDHDPEIVGYMINFLYSGDYTILQPKPEKAEKPEKTEESEWPDVQQSLQIQTLASEALVIHTAVYLIADEKDIPALKMLAKKKYEATLPHGWNSAQFCTTLKMIWDGTPENDTLLWDSAASYAGKKAKELMDHGEFATLCKENVRAIGFLFSLFPDSEALLLHRPYS